MRVPSGQHHTTEGGVTAPAGVASLVPLLGSHWRAATAMMGEVARALGPASTLLAWWAVRLALAAGLVALLAGVVLMSARSARAQGRGTQPPTVLQCLDTAAAERGLDPQLLRAVARAESNLNPLAVNRSHRERTGTVDIGLLQINSGWLPTLRGYGIRERDLYDGCTNARVGAWLLADALARHGNTWNAVGSYNAACTELRGERCARARQDYAWRVFRRMDSRTPSAQATLASHSPKTSAAAATPTPAAGLIALTQLHEAPTAHSTEQ